MQLVVAEYPVCANIVERDASDGDIPRRPLPLNPLTFTEGQLPYWCIEGTPLNFGALLLLLPQSKPGYSLGETTFL